VLHNPGYYVATITRMDSLLMGALLAALLYRFRYLVNSWSKALFLLSGIAIVAGLLLTRNPDYSNPFFVTAGYTLLAVFFAAVIAIVIEEKNNLLKRSLNNRPLIFLGKYSYGLYVFHFPVFWLLREPLFAHFSKWIASPNIAKLGVSLACLAITIACALLSYRLIEKPFLRLKDHFGNSASAKAKE
jgi:peptidoglycan/LPS O-acetylase OafA/YrhL